MNGWQVATCVAVESFMVPTVCDNGKSSRRRRRMCALSVGCHGPPAWAHDSLTRGLCRAGVLNCLPCA